MRRDKIYLFTTITLTPVSDLKVSIPNSEFK